MGKTYFLDLQTLLVYLRGKSCTLSTALTIAGKRASGTILLKDGAITGCFIQMPDGSQQEGKQAYERLKSRDEWQVTLEQHQAQPNEQISPSQGQPTRPLRQLSPQSPRQPNPQSLSPVFPHCFRQRRSLDTLMPESLSMRQRMVLRTVYMAIDGQRSPEQIKTLISNIPGEIIDQALKYLFTLGAIE